MSMLLVTGMLRGMADVVHVRRRSQGPVKVLVGGVGSPVRSRLAAVVRLAVDGAVSGGERVPELDGCVGIHWVRRVYASGEERREVVSGRQLAGRACEAVVSAEQCCDVLCCVVLC